MDRRLLSCVLFASACVPAAPVEVGEQHAAVIAGSDSPDAYQFPIDRLERHASLAARYDGNQGCTGTLVGDRIVVSAAHCAVVNQQAWVGGAAPELVDASHYRYTVGDDIDKPICELSVASVQIHPNVDPKGDFVAHDISISILADSAMSKCPGVVPVQANLDPLDQSLVGTSLLQGGFGSQALDYHFSKQLKWSLLQVDDVMPGVVVMRDQDKGQPSYGDSGSGLLRRFPDGSLRTVGIESTMAIGGQFHSFVRVDDQASFIKQTIASQSGADPLCGTFTEKGSCVDDAVVTCGTQGFRSTDCRADGKSCVVDAQGTASCTCLDCAEPATPEQGCTVGGRPRLPGWPLLLVVAMALGWAAARRGSRPRAT